MRLFGYPYNDLVICKDSPDYLKLNSSLTKMIHYYFLKKLASSRGAPQENDAKFRFANTPEKNIRKNKFIRQNFRPGIIRRSTKNFKKKNLMRGIGEHFRRYLDLDLDM